MSPIDPRTLGSRFRVTSFNTYAGLTHGAETQDGLVQIGYGVLKRHEGGRRHLCMIGAVQRLAQLQNASDDGLSFMIHEFALRCRLPGVHLVADVKEI